MFLFIRSGVLPSGAEGGLIDCLTLSNVREVGVMLFWCAHVEVHSELRKEVDHPGPAGNGSLTFDWELET